MPVCGACQSHAAPLRPLAWADLGALYRWSGEVPDLNMAAGVEIPVPANIVSGSAGSVDRAHTQCSLRGESKSRHVLPASSLRYSPLSVPVNTTSGRSGRFNRDRTSASECSPWSIPSRCHVSPPSGLLMTPYGPHQNCHLRRHEVASFSCTGTACRTRTAADPPLPFADVCPRFGRRVGRFGVPCPTSRHRDPYGTTSGISISLSISANDWMSVSMTSRSLSSCTSTRADRSSKTS